VLPVNSTRRDASVADGDQLTLFRDAERMGSFAAAHLHYCIHVNKAGKDVKLMEVQSKSRSKIPCLKKVFRP
jgi:hypothetical protein